MIDFNNTSHPGTKPIWLHCRPRLLRGQYLPLFCHFTTTGVFFVLTFELLSFEELTAEKFRSLWHEMNFQQILTYFI